MTLDDDLWATKLDAVRAYRSQVPPTASLWPDETAMLREHGKAVLDATLAVRSDAPFACKGGVCGTCRAKLLDGTVRMDTNWALEPDEVEAGYVLTCQSHPTSPARSPSTTTPDLPPTGNRTSSQTRRWSLLGNGNSPVSRESGSARQRPEHRRRR